MATSGDTTWTLNRDQVITGALRKLGVLASGATPDSDQINDGAQALNAIIKAFHADGMPVWKIMDKTFTVTENDATYTIAPSGADVTGVVPLKVLQAFRTPSGGVNIPMTVFNRYDFKLLTVSDTTIGEPINLYYQPFPTSGTIKVWPIPENSTTTITIHYHAPYEDMDAASDNFDFPSYWIQALIYTLAWSLSPEFGIPPTDRKLLQAEALFWKSEALSYGSEEGSMFMQPDRRGF